MVNLRCLYQEICLALQKAEIEDADFEAKELLKIAKLGDVRLTPERTVSPQEYAAAANLLNRRLRHEPLQYLANEWDFMDFTVVIGEGVLIPRDDTEVCTCLAIEAAKQFDAPRIVDLCSGSGIIALSIARHCKKAQVTAVEFSEKAFAYLQINNRRYHNCLKTVQADIFHWNHDLKQDAFEIIVSNPPYLSEQEYRTLAPELYFEPKMALVASDNGLAFYSHIASAYFACLTNGGFLIFEIGETQAEQVCDICIRAGYSNIEVHFDLEKRPRAIIAQKENTVITQNA